MGALERAAVMLVGFLFLDLDAAGHTAVGLCKVSQLYFHDRTLSHM